MSEWQARKRFGQHFLIDRSLLQAIANSISPKADDHMVEIGPGRGALTDYLLARPMRLLDVIEIDRDLIAFLQSRYEKYAHMRIHQADVLTVDLAQLRITNEKLRVVGNLPYNISTPLLIKLLKQIDCINDMHFLLQQEVAQRLCAPVGDAHYGRLSVLTQFYCQAQLILHVPPCAFKPPPRVQSALIRLQVAPRHQWSDNEINYFFELVKMAFAHRRKTLANNLKSRIPTAMLSSIGIDPSYRPQQLSVTEFCRLSQHAFRLAQGEY